MMNEPIVVELPELIGGQVAVVTIRPDDILVFMVPEGRPLMREQVARISDTLKATLPDVKALVLDNGMTFGVVRRAP